MDLKEFYKRYKNTSVLDADGSKIKLTDPEYALIESILSLAFEIRRSRK